MVAFLLTHLWQSTLVLLGAWALAWVCRNNGAAVRYWIWFVASMKFLVPLTVLQQLGDLLGRSLPEPLLVDVALIESANAMFAPSMPHSLNVADDMPSQIASIAVALWALLPLIATQRLGLGAGGYGVLFGAFGLGAVVGAVVLGRVRERLSTNGMLGAAGILYAATLAAIVLVPSFPAALAILVLAFFLDKFTAERAVNSFQLDETLLASIANLTGDPTFRTWAPNKFGNWFGWSNDIARDFHWHMVVTEYAHTRLQWIADAAADTGAHRGAER